MKISWLAFMIVATFAACSNEGKGKENNAIATDSISKSEPVTADSASEYLPVKSMLAGDLKEIETYGAAILLRSKSGNKTDSAYIKVPQLLTLAQHFFPGELEPELFTKHFKESSMMDQATGSTTFLYTTESQTSVLRKVIVYVSPGHALDKVSRIYMEKQELRGDTTITQRLTWKLKEYFIIAESKEGPAGLQTASIKKAIWEPNLFGEEF
ncbi:MAG: hypothetical protein H7Y31_15670 [Chitinophagaceae bacterium]|nr:hypothetical protein [Chitinophagaceae bacterium]